MACCLSQKTLVDIPRHHYFVWSCQAQNCQLDLWPVMVLWLGGYGPSDPASSYFHLFGPLEKHLAGKHFATEANMKCPVTFWLQTLDTNLSMTGCKPSHSGTNSCMSLVSKCISHDYHLLPMCHVHNEVWTNFLASKCLLPCFLKLLELFGYFTISSLHNLHVWGVSKSLNQTLPPKACSTYPSQQRVGKMIYSHMECVQQYTIGYVSPSSTSKLPFSAPHNCDILLPCQNEQWSIHKFVLKMSDFIRPGADSTA